MRDLSLALRQAIHAQESAAVLLTLVELTHDDWDAPVRLVNDHAAIEHDGETYAPCAFAVTLPDDEEASLPVLRWAIDGVDRELVARMRSVTAGNVAMRVSWVLADTPDEVEVEFAALEVTAADYDSGTVRGVATVEPILDEPVSRMRMTPQNAPGLF